ncbi:MAG: F0F1 ATP synthase subunit A [Clostridiales Family XIII bacterium]|nr:F0F1 ATP synthase subunit A [Clostridiales Family XIII bacterium]
MHDVNNIGPRIILEFDSGPLKGLYITETVFWTIAVAIALIIFTFVSTRKLERYPKGIQAFAEFIVELVYKYVKDTMGPRNLAFAPFIGTLFLFLIVGNALGLLGIRPITADLNTTFAMAGMVFFLIQYNAIRSGGIKHYFKHFAEPYSFMVPIKVLEEFTFPVSLSFRIFGNILAGVIVMGLVFSGLGYLSEHIAHLPIPLFETVIPLPLNLFFDIFEPLLQAFVFSMLTMAFIARAIVSHDDI